VENLCRPLGGFYLGVFILADTAPATPAEPGGGTNQPATPAVPGGGFSDDHEAVAAFVDSFSQDPDAFGGDVAGTGFEDGETPPAAALDPDSADLAVDEVEQPEEEEAQVSEDEETSEQEAAEDEDGKDENADAEEGEALPETFDEFAEAIEIEADSLMGLKMEIKAAGQTELVTIDQLRTGYQRGADYQKNNERLKADRSILEEREKEAIDLWTQRLQQADAILHQLEQRPADGLGPEQLEQLADEDPSEYVKVLARRETSRNERNKLQGALNDQIAAQNDEATKQLQQNRQREFALLRDRQPEWADDKKAKETAGKIASHLINNVGFPQEQVHEFFQGGFHHLMMIVAQQAMEGEASKAAVKKLPKKMPSKVKFKRPKASVEKKGKSNKTSALFRALESTGGRDDVAEALAAQLLDEGG